MIEETRKMAKKHKNRLKRAILVLVSFCAFLSLPSTILGRTGLKGAEEGSIFVDPFESGYIGITSDPENNQLFYLLFRSRADPDTDPLLIWLSGGPGCSSMFAAAVENGPFTLHKNLTTTKNQWSWNNKANVLYLDQPLGTGFSFGNRSNYAKNSKTTKTDFLEFLKKFIKKHPEFAQRPLFIAGESYAGHYIPQVASAIFDLGDPDLNLQGIAIGNGQINPVPQNYEFLPYLWDQRKTQNLIKNGYTREEYESDLRVMELGNYDWGRFSPFHALGRPSEIVDLMRLNVNKLGFNPYDVRKECKGLLCDDTGYVTDFFSDPKIQKILGTKKSKFAQCDPEVGKILGAVDPRTNAGLDLARIVRAGYKVLVYNGEFDSVCNWYGTRRVLSELDWIGRRVWNGLQMGESRLGAEKRYMNLRFVKVRDSGHMVPRDQPELAYVMISEFLGDSE